MPKNSPRNFERGTCFDFHLLHVIDFDFRPRSLNLIVGTPARAATHSVQRVCGWREDWHWKLENIPSKQGKDTLLIWLWALLNLRFKIFSILLGRLFSYMERGWGKLGLIWSYICYFSFYAPPCKLVCYSILYVIFMLKEFNGGTL